MTIRFADNSDLEFLISHDRHISENELRRIVSINRVYIAEENGQLIGWLRYGLFWDNTPFMNMLFFLSEYREKGFGRKLVEHWENDMRALGYECVMTSAMQEEWSQHFYNRLGYHSTGGFFPHNESYELIFEKEIAASENEEA